MVSQKEEHVSERYAFAMSVDNAGFMKESAVDCSSPSDNVGIDLLQHLVNFPWIQPFGLRGVIGFVIFAR